MNNIEQSLTFILSVTDAGSHWQDDLCRVEVTNKGCIQFTKITETCRLWTSGMDSADICDWREEIRNQQQSLQNCMQKRPCAEHVQSLVRKGFSVCKE